MLTDIGFDEVVVGDPIDTFEGATGETNARAFGVHGHPFRARRP